MRLEMIFNNARKRTRSALDWLALQILLLVEKDPEQRPFRHVINSNRHAKTSARPEPTHVH